MSTDKENNYIVGELFRLQDVKYRDFLSRLIPTLDPGCVIGVRTPELRKLAKEISRGENSEVFAEAFAETFAKTFLKELPHKYFEENQLHAFIISDIKNYDECAAEVDRFLPYVDNWATCDQMSPKVFRKHKDELLADVKRWIDSGETYAVRFGIRMLMEHYLDDDFDRAYPEMVCGVRSDEYYVRMMQAWYFATALAKQYEQVLVYIEEQRLDTWTHNKAIRKAIESYRITPEQKEYLRSLKVKAGSRDSL